MTFATPRAGRWMLAAGLLALLSSQLHAGRSIPVNYDDKRGIVIKMTQVFESLPPYGYMPVRIEIENKSNYDRTWQFRFTNQRHISYHQQVSMNYSHELTVENKATRTFNLLIPLAPRSSTHSYSNQLGYQATGYALSNDTFTPFATSSVPSDPTPYFLLGNEYAKNLWSQIDSTISGARMNLDGSRVDPKELPVDWRGYAGCSLVMLSENEWRQLNTAQKLALTNWVAQGGTLGLLGTGGAPDLPALLQRPKELIQRSNNNDSIPIGFGKVVGISGGPTLAQTISRYIQHPSFALPSVDEARTLYVDDWGLADTLSGITANQGLMLLFVVVFAIIVGPLNLFFFANRKHRYRLFWTTPLISLGASALLCLVILVFDGLGGTGVRMVVGIVMPENNNMVVCQEQISRTAVLYSAGFQPGNDTSFQQVVFATDSPSYKPIKRKMSDGSISSIFSAELSQRGNLNFYQDAGWYSGDYFQSRAVQAQYVSALRSTRNAIELVGVDADGTPKVVSTFGQSIRQLYYRDGQDRIWKVENLKPGAQPAMEEVKNVEFNRFWKEQIRLAGGDLSTRLRDVKDRKNFFFAQSVEGHSGPAINSLPSVRWQTGPILYLGSLVPPNSGGSAP